MLKSYCPSGFTCPGPLGNEICQALSVSSGLNSYTLLVPRLELGHGSWCHGFLLVQISSSHGIMYWPHDDVIKWKHFPRYSPFVRGIQRSPVNSPAQRPVAQSFDVFFDPHLNKRLSKQSWGWGFLRWHRAHYDVTVVHVWWMGPCLPWGRISSICHSRVSNWLTLVVPYSSMELNQHWFS